MILHDLLNDTRMRFARLQRELIDAALRRPGRAAASLLGLGLLLGAGASLGVGFAATAGLRAQAALRRDEVDAVRTQAQREVNALAARLAELQAQANRLNALGERLTQIGQLADGEFDFDKPVGIGGAGPVHDMPPAQLR